MVAFVLFLCCFPTKDIEQKSGAKAEMFQAWRNLWINIFKFQAPYRTDRREFTLAIATSLASFAVMFACAIFSYEVSFGAILIVRLALGIAFLSLMARRLRDAGFSAWLVLPLTSVIFVFYQLLILLFKDASRALQLFFMFGSIYLVYLIVILALCFFPTNKIK